MLFELIFLSLVAKIKRQCGFIVPSVGDNQITANFLKIMTVLTQ